ncbi:MAG: VanZ family protein [Fidelibacterota bacterium]
MKYSSLHFWILIFYVLVIFGLTSIPGDSLQKFTIFATNDKIIHFLEYFILGFLFFNALKTENQNRYGILITILFLIIVPILDENLQRLIPGRFPDYKDSIIDFLGGICGTFTHTLRKYVIKSDN